MMDQYQEDITLDYPAEEFEEILQRSVRLIIKTYRQLEHQKVFVKKTPQDIAKPFEEPLPAHPAPQDQLWETIEKEVVGNATLSAGPHFYSYVLSPGNQIGLAGEMISTFLNQNPSKWHLGPAAAEIEKVALRWIAEFIGYGSGAGGIFVSGGSMANLTCLTVARNQKAGIPLNHQGLYQQKPMIIYLTDQAHYCVDKAMAILGMGRDHMRRIGTNHHFQMDVKALKAAIIDDLQKGLHPFCVVASAGTVNTGAIDPMDQIADICEQYDLWFHVDAAYGGPAAALESQKPAFRGLDRADSMALDPHKWLYVPIEAGCALFKDPSAQRETYSLVPEYLKVDKSVDETRTDFMEYGLQLTRSFRALKVWITFKAFGSQRLKQAIEHDINKTLYLTDLIKRRKDFEVLAPVSLSIVCFRYHPRDLQLPESELQTLNIRLLHALEEDGRVFITGTTIRGKTALRACIINHRTQFRHLDHLMNIVTTKAQNLLQMS